jgi:hypothetical protein
MGLRCLLGHDFGPSGVVREHEQDGSEMVVTEREIRRCRRCGEEQVLSESTEVRAIRPESDVRPERRDADAVAPASSTQGADVGDEASPLGGERDTESPVGDDEPTESTPDTAALRNAADSVTGPGDASPASTSETAPELDASTTTVEDTADEPASNTSLIDRAEAGFDEPADPDEEDAVILDTDDEPERERGAWPDSDDVGSRSDVSASDDSSVDPVATDSQSDADESLPEREDTETQVDADADDEVDEPQSLAERAAEEDAELMGSASESDTDDAGTKQPDTASTEGAWPAHDGEDQGFSAGTATSGGPGMAYGNELTPGSGSGSGSTNGRSQHDQSSADYETSYLENTVEQRDGDGTIVSAGSSERSAPRPGAETEYYCPNCGHTRPLDSSLRTGDICPECQQGYIAEREQ